MTSDEAVEAAMRSIYSKTGVVTEPDVRAALAAAAPHLLKDMRPMTSVELAARDRPESMAAARAKVREDRAAYQAEMFRAAREAAWDEGQRAWEDELLNKTPGTNPYRN